MRAIVPVSVSTKPGEPQVGARNPASHLLARRIPAPGIAKYVALDAEGYAACDEPRDHQKNC
jgi:hypothetical protein